MAVSPAKRTITTSSLSPQTNMLAESFDDVEESLRNDLRRNDHVIKGDNTRNMLLNENSNLKHPNCITAFEQRTQARKFRNMPNMNENFLPHPALQSRLMNSSSITSSSDINQEIPQSDVDEFKNYCSLLTDRICKVEEQNLELQRIAERQKFEYDKVVAQVMESEQSQRLLINECCILRHQVQQLASHNKILKDQQTILAYDPSLAKDSPVQADVKSMKSSSQKSFTKNNLQQLTQTLKQLQHTNGAVMENCTPDTTAAVELIAALQLTTQVNPQAQVTEEATSNPSHVQSIPNTELSVIPEKRDFSNQMCNNPINGANNNLQNLKRQCIERLSSEALHRNSQTEEISSADNQQSVNAHSIASDKSTNRNIEAANFRQDSRLRRSQTHLNSSSSKRKELQRPSSLIIDSDYSLARRLAPASNEYPRMKYGAPARNLFPASTPTSPQASNPPHLNRINSSSNNTHIQSCADSNTAKSNAWLQRKSSSSSSLLDDTFQHQTKQCVSNKPQDFVPETSEEFRSTISTSSPDTPKIESELKSKNETPLRSSNSRSNLDEEILEQPALNKDFSDQSSASDETAKTKTNLDCQRQDKSAISRRRHSYGRACRKSQSLDLLSGPAAELTLPPSDHLSSSDTNQDKDNQTHDTQRVSSFIHVDNCIGKSQVTATNELDDSGFVSPKIQQIQQVADSKCDHESKNKQEKKRPVKPIRSHLKKKVLSNKKQTSADETDSTVKDKQTNSQLEYSNVVSEEANSNEFALDDQNFRSRGYSEGSAANKKKNKLFGESGKRQLKRQISVGGNIGRKVATKPQIPVSLPCHEMDFVAVTNDNYVTEDCELISDESFVSTNDFQLTCSTQHSKTKSTPNLQKNLSVASPKSLKQPQSISSSKSASADVNSSSSSGKWEAVFPEDLKRSKLKLSKRSKSTNILVQKDSKKATSSGTPSKSLVNIVKSKFGRSSSTAKLSLASKKNQLEPIRRNDGPKIIKPIKPSMKPVLSLENVAYLPPGKDGDSARKLTKQKHIEQEKNAENVGFSTNTSEEELPPKDPERRASEEMLSDEGFADGSTIERSETEEYQLPEDIELLRSKMFVLSKSNSEPQTNTVSSTESENSGCGGFKPTENSKWPSQNNRASFDDSKLCDEMFSSFEKGLDPGVFATGVTIVPTSALRRTNRALAPSNRLKSKKIPKPQNGGALGRLIKNVSNHYSGSKEDLSQNKDQTNRLSQGKELKKNQLSGYQRDIEQAYMSSIVQAELTQGLQGRSISSDSFTKVKSDNIAESNLPSSTSPSKLDGSTGTGSSISSLLSMGTASIHSGDISDGQPNESGMPHLKNSILSKKTEKALNIKLPGAGIAISTKIKPRANSDASLLDSKLSKKSPHISTETNFGANRLPEAPTVGDVSAGISGTPQKSSPMRNSKLAAPAKLSPSRKTSGLMKSKIKLREKTSLPSTVNQTAKTKLAPLNYGFSPVQGKPAARSKASSIHIDSSTQQTDSPTPQLETKSKSALASTRNSKPSLRIPVSRPSARCGSIQLEGPKSRSSSIPSTGIYRPKPVFNVAAT